MTPEYSFQPWRISLYVFASKRRKPEFYLRLSDVIRKMSLWAKPIQRHLLKHKNVLPGKNQSNANLDLANLLVTIIQSATVSDLGCRHSWIVFATKFLQSQLSHVCNCFKINLSLVAGMVVLWLQKFCCHHYSTTYAIKMRNCCRTVAHIFTKMASGFRFTYFVTSHTL